MELAAMGRGAYERFSEERGRPSTSNADQLSEIKEHFARNGWPFNESLNFQDDDISASMHSTKERPGYRAMLDVIRAGQIVIIVVTEMTRLFRQVAELLELINIAGQLPALAIETTGGARCDLKTNQGMHDALEAVVDASRESGKISDRVKRAKRARAREGRWNGGSRPYGYAKPPNGEPGELAIVPAEAEIVRELAERVLGGEAMVALAGELNDRKVPTATNGRWHVNTVRRVLTNPVMKGVRVHNGTEYPAAWSAIISAEDFERLQLILSDASRHVGHTGKGVRSYLLTGLIECGVCGADGTTHVKLVGGQKKVNKEREPKRRYRCRKTGNFGQQVGCGRILRMADPIEALVSETVLARFERSEDLAALIAPEAPVELHELAADLIEDKRRLDDANRDRYRRDDDPLRLDPKDFARIRGEIEDAMEATRRRMARLEQGRVLASIPVGKTLRDSWHAADLGWRRTVLSLVVERVVLHPGRPGSRRWPTEDDPEYERIVKGYPGAPWAFDGSLVRIFWKV